MPRLFPLLAVCPVLLTAAVHAATWSDGSSIVRFDKRPDCPMNLAADWRGLPERRWAGPSIWTSRLQDWAVRDGALRCEPKEDLPCRTAHLLTYELGPEPGPFRLSVVLTLAPGSAQTGFAGFLVGAGEGRLDYRGAALVHHMSGRGGGLMAVVETSGQGALAFRDMSTPEAGGDNPLIPGQETLEKQPIRLDYHRMVLNLEGVPAANDTYDLRFSVWAQNAGDLLGAQELRGIPAARFRGNVALVANPGGPATRHVFEEFAVGGEKLVPHPERAFGPIAGALYSISGRTLKLGVQCMALGEATRADGRRLCVHFRARPVGDPNAQWITFGDPQAIAPPDYYALFRLPDWDSSHAWDGMVTMDDADGKTCEYPLTIQADPVGKPVVSLAAFTGMGAMGRTANARGPQEQPGEVIVGRWTPANVWAPHERAVRALLRQNLDILFFTGDQIYEGKPTPPDATRTPYEDYLYKWLIWHWSFRELTNHLPTICQADDHDVYHGNLWGWGGRLNLTNDVNQGGYTRSAYFVNMVHRTQTAHNPDAFDPGPAQSGITHYYCAFTYGGIGFAVLEDRKFKTPPTVTDPAKQTLLGERQLEFLHRWGDDWTGQKLKVIISQTIYSSTHTDFNGALARDPDSGGFPKVGRDAAVRAFRRCSALLVAGDQHLGTFTRIGVEAPSDAVYQFCVPALANIFWRWWYPNVAGTDRAPGEAEWQGEFTDAWGNFLRVIAVANPERQDLLSQRLRQRNVIPADEAASGKGDTARTCLGDGYGIVRMDKAAQTLTCECWPQDADPQTGKQFPGWPITLHLADLDGRKPVAWLPDLRILGQPDPVVLIVDQATGEIIKSTRARDNAFRPGVFDAARTYELRVGEPGGKWWTARDLKPLANPGTQSLEVDLRP